MRIMFNNTIYQESVVSTHVTAVTGSITKTYIKSYFERFHLSSRNSQLYLSKDSPIVIIQMVVVGDMEVIAEIMGKDDYDKLFKNKDDE